MNTKGEILKNIREYLHLSQNAMGEYLGCSGTQIRRYEKGVYVITDDLEQLICDKFSLPRNIFDGLSGDNNITEALESSQKNRDEKAQSLIEGIGERVFKLRKSLGLTQEEFGKACGCSAVTICNIETAAIKMSDKNLKDISNTFCVGYEWLKFGDETQKDYPLNDVLMDWIRSSPEIRKKLWEKMRSKNDKSDS